MYNFAFHLIIIILFSFTRDSWPYLLILLYGMLGIYALTMKRKMVKYSLLFLLVSISIFFVQQHSAEKGQRYRLPITNNILLRIVPNEEYLEWFTSRGMPQSERLKDEFSNITDRVQIYQIYNDSSYINFFEWAVNDGKSLYTKFLISHPSYALLLKESRQDRSRIFAHDFGYIGDPQGWSRISKPLFPLFNLLAVLVLSGILLFLFLKESRFILLFPVFLLVLFTFNAFLLYLADALEVERHLFFTQVMIQFIGILGVSLIADSPFMISFSKDIYHRVSRKR